MRNWVTIDKFQIKFDSKDNPVSIIATTKVWDYLFDLLHSENEYFEIFLHGEPLNAAATIK